MDNVHCHEERLWHTNGSTCEMWLLFGWKTERDPANVSIVGNFSVQTSAAKQITRHSVIGRSHSNSLKHGAPLQRIKYIMLVLQLSSLWKINWRWGQPTISTHCLSSPVSITSPSSDPLYEESSFELWLQNIIHIPDTAKLHMLSYSSRIYQRNVQMHLDQIHQMQTTSRKPA